MNETWSMTEIKLGVVVAESSPQTILQTLTDDAIMASETLVLTIRVNAVCQNMVVHESIIM